MVSGGDGMRIRHTFWALALMYARKVFCNVPQASVFGLFRLDGRSALLLRVQACLDMN